MSMYGVNADVPKTLVRHIVRYAADAAENEALRAVLLDILDTPVSPELLPANENGEIAQQTESLVGPYELHDFYLYYVLRFGFGPASSTSWDKNHTALHHTGAGLFTLFRLIQEKFTFHHLDLKSASCCMMTVT